jgi:hypothetical protein
MRRSVTLSRFVKQWAVYVPKNSLSLPLISLFSFCISSFICLMSLIARGKPQIDLGYVVIDSLHLDYVLITDNLTS